jgi:hypothetical protein
LVDKVEVFVTDLYKKHKGKELYKGFYTVGKRIYQDDGQIVTKSIALDKEALEVLRAKIMAMFIDEIKPKSNTKSSSSKTKQTKLL